MAKDKAVDSASLDAGLKAIADAIREKAGTSDALAFPEGMAAAIRGIETGGGGNIVVGSVTPETNGAITITHNWGEEYNTSKKISGKTTILIIAASSSWLTNGVYSICCVGNSYGANGSGTEYIGVNSTTIWGNKYIHTTSPKISNATGDSFSINNSNASYPFIAGTTYYYAVWDNEAWKG